MSTYLAERPGGKTSDSGPHRPSLQAANPCAAERPVIGIVTRGRASLQIRIKKSRALVRRRLSEPAWATRILAILVGGIYGCTASAGRTLSRPRPGRATPFGGRPHHQHVYCTLEDIYRFTPKREMVGPVPADGDRIHSSGLHRRPESWVPQDHGESNAVATEGARAPGEAAC